jgi:1-acyl-sn-glycerol-3-phosphate acyltransferase
MAFFRTLIWFIRFWLYQLIAIPALFKIRRLGRQGKTAEHDALLHRIVGRWARTMFTMAGGHVRVEGLNNLVDGPAVYVANHLGYFDIPLMIGFLGDDTKPMMAKKQITKIPGIASWMRELHCVFVDRDHPRESVKALKESEHWLSEGYSMVIFPEGTRSRDGAVHTFKSGAFRIAKADRVPVVPCVIEGTERMMRPGSIWIYPAEVSLTVLPAIPTADFGKKEWRELPQRAQRIVSDYRAKQLESIKQKEER